MDDEVVKKRAEVVNDSVEYQTVMAITTYNPYIRISQKLKNMFKNIFLLGKGEDDSLADASRSWGHIHPC